MSAYENRARRLPALLHDGKGGLARQVGIGLPAMPALRPASLRVAQHIKTILLASARLPDGTQLDLIEHPDDPGRTAFAVAQGGNLFIADWFPFQRFQILPLPRQHRLVRALLLPNGLEQLGSVEDLVRRIGELLNSQFRLSEDLQISLGSFVLHTWVADSLPLSPIPILVSPVNISRPLIAALRTVCRNALVVGSARQDGILKVWSEVGATLLFVDYGSRSHFPSYILMGTRRGQVTLSAGGPISTYGPKLLATPSIPEDTSLLADAIIIRLPLTGAMAGHEPGSDIAHEAMSIRNQLLRLRLEPLQHLDPNGVDLALPCSAQKAQLLRVLAAPFAGERGFCDTVVRAALACAGPTPERISPALKAVISALVFFVHEWAGSCIVATERLLSSRKASLHGHAAKWREEPSLEVITDLANGALGGSGKNKPLTTTVVGRIFTDLNLAGSRPKTSRYRLLLTDDTVREIHLLEKTFGTFAVDAEPQSMLFRPYCPLCREMGLVSEKAIRFFEEQYAPKIKEAQRKLGEESDRRFAEYQKSERLSESSQPAINEGDNKC